MKKIAILHWGELTINAYYLAYALHQHNISIDFYLYSPRQAYKRSYLRNLRDRVKSEFCVTEFKSSIVEAGLIKCSALFNNNENSQADRCLNPYLASKTRKIIRTKKYEYIITTGQTSLYWLYKTDQDALKKTIHYSLEIQKVTDPHFITPAFAKILEWEARLLKKVMGLIVQDVFRAEALLNCKIDNSKLLFFFIPVSILSKNASDKNYYLHTQLNISPQKKVLLYFGAVYTERFLEQISETFENQLDDSWVLVYHGPDKFSEKIAKYNKTKISSAGIEYENLHLIMRSATIGLAFYDNSWPNTRLTAFSSEKIARYLEVGVPFIAFENESYLKLKNEFNCCMLLNDIADLSNAIRVIMNDYESYQANSFKAFNKYYNITNSILPLSNFIKEKQLHGWHNNLEDHTVN